MNRAYSVLNVKKIDEQERVIEGIASTPSTDRQGDIVEPMGAKFTLPLPAFLFHDAENPVASVEWAKPNKDGIPYRMRFPAEGVLETVDKAWKLVKHLLVRGVSIGFSPLEWEPIKDSKVGGIHYKRWEWLELSLVSIPANAEATIHTIKEYDDASRTASGAGVVEKESVDVTLADSRYDLPIPLVYGMKRETGKIVWSSDDPPGVSGKQVSDQMVARLAHAIARDPKTQRGTKMKTTQEKIASYEASRAAKAARMQAIMDASDEAGRSLDEQEAEEYDGLERDVEATDAHLVRMRKQEKLMVATAVPVRPTVPGEGSSESKTPIIKMGKDLPKGTAFTRYVMATAAAKGNRAEALEIAEKWKDTPQVFNAIKNRSQDLVEKAAVTGGTTTDADWAEPLVEYQTMASEFLDLLRPKTIIGRIPGLRRVPFNIRVASKSQSSTVGWVGEGAAKPVSELKFLEQTLGFAKAAGIVVISQELARFSSPAAVELIQRDLTDTMTQFLDVEFIDPANAAVANISPASVTFGAQKITSTGSTVAQIKADLAALMALFIAENMAPENAVLIMRPETAMGLMMKSTSQDILAFPGITTNGGTLFGMQVITSRSVPTSASGGTIIVMLDGSEIFLADDGGVRIDVSEQASIQMDSAPTNANGTPTTLVSLWQTNQLGVRVEKMINWGARRANAVAYIDQVPSYV